MLVVLSIAVGIFAVAIMMGGRAVLMRALDTSFPLTRPPSVTFITQPFDEHLVHSVAAQPGVAAAQGRRASQLRGGRVCLDSMIRFLGDEPLVRQLLVLSVV